MKKNYILFILIFLSFQVFAQISQEQAYAAEDGGYFINPVETPYGIIFTDNYASQIYLLKNGKVKTLVASPGCGRYFTVSENGKFISYKSINEKGEQAPAYFDLENKNKIIADYSKKCSQITVEENQTKEKILKLSNLKSQFSNLTPISPNGKYLIYDKNQKYFNILNIENQNETQIHSDGKGVIFPKWSPDSKKILYQNKDMELLVYEIESKKLHKLGKGGAGNWDKNSEDIVFQVTYADASNFILKSSEIYISDYKGNNIRQITNTPDIFEMNPSFDLQGGIIYQTYDKRQIVRAKLDEPKSKIISTKILLDNPKSLKPKFYDTGKFTQTKSITHLTNDVPYIHQKYDAPTGRNGGSACAPTTSNMAMAYYNRLPKWPIPATTYTYITGKTTSDYGGYVLDRYKYNEHSFDAYSSSKNAFGGYAYMWIDPYLSPGGGDGMRNYQNHHGMTSGSYVWLSSATFEKTCAEIDNEYPHSICSWITHSGHLTLAVGYVNGQHTVIFNDPWGNKNTPSYPSYDGKDSYYDWPGYNNGYQNLDPDGSHGTVAWTLTARSSQPTYDDLTINNIDYNHGFYINNSQNGAIQRYYRHVQDVAGSSGHIWWTGGEGGAASDICYVSWTPNLPTAGTYKVEVYIPAAFTDSYSAAAVTSSANYTVYYDGGNTTTKINQLASQGTWVDLGNYQFSQGQNGYVRVGDAVDVADNGKKVLFDAVRFTQVAGNMVVTSTNVTCTGVNDGTASVTSVPCANPTYLWSPGGETTASVSGLSGGNYSVSVTDDCNTYNASVTIEEATQLLALTTTDTDPSGFGLSDGQITVNVSGGEAPFVYVWSPSVSTTNLAQNLPAGNYQITVTDAYGCSKIINTSLTDPVCTSCCVLLEEDFSTTTGTTPPSGWTNIDHAISNYKWFFDDPSNRWGSGFLAGADFDADFAIFDDDNLGNNGNLSDASLTTPAINCSGRDMVMLKFTQRFRHSTNTANGKVQVSTDGSTWNDIVTYNTVTVEPEITEFDISAYAANQATVYVRWRYIDASNWSNYWAIDNIKIYAPPAGTKTISANGGDYLNFTEAINAINNCGIGTGGVTFLVSDDEIFTEDPPIITATGEATKPVVFIKDGTGANPILKPTGTVSTSDAGFALAGSDYFTFDGIDVQIASGSALEFGYYLYNISDVDGAQHNTIKNCSITLDKSNTNSVGVKQLVQTTINPTTVDGANSFNIYQNLIISNTYMGINLYGYEAIGQDALYDDACEISNCNISNFGGSNIRAAGILAWEQKNTNFFENEIYAGSTTLRTYGIYLADYSSGNIYKNRIYDIYGTDSQVAGIRTYEADCNIFENEVSDIEGVKMAVGIEAFGGTSSIYNNFVYDIKAPTGNSVANGYPSARGISLRETSGTQNVYYNTVYLSYTSTNAGNESTGLFADNTIVDLRNNIFENNSLATTGTRAVVLYFGDGADITNLSANTDNNLYYNGSAITKYALAYEKAGGTSYLDLTAYKIPSPNDVNSIEENPPFKSTVLPYNVHLDPTQSSGIDGGGQPIAGITTDIDGEVRNITTPDIGADEYDTGGPLCGAYTIDNSLATAGTNYNNFTDAINDLNDRGISCAVIFNVHDNQTFSEDLPVLETTGTVANTITFQKSGGGANPILQPTGGVREEDYGIHINGGDYYTFDGIDVQISGGSDLEYGYYLTSVSATDGAQHNTIKNCTITLNNSNVNSVGIYQLVRTDIPPTATSGANSYNIYDNVTVENAYFGMKIYGYDVTGQEPLYDDATEIMNCTINNFGHTGVAERAVGIHTWSQKNLDIHDNTVTNGTTNLRTLGIYTAGNNQGNVYNNLVHGLYGTDSQVVGLRAYESDVDFYNNETYDIEGVDMASGIEIFGGTANIYNNFVRDIRTPGTDTYNYPTTRGISHRKGTTNIYNNSVLLNYTSTAETNESAGIFIEGFYGATATSDIRNNVIVNKTDVSTGGFAVACYKSAEYATIETTSDNNLYYAGTPSAKNLIYYDTNVSDQTLENYKTRCGTYEQNSISEDPPFVSTSDLHIQTSAVTFIDGGGQVIGSITTDFDGDTRDASVPDMGADEYECDFIVWHGTTDTDWATASNWQKQQVPTSADDAIIPDVSLKSNNFPIITSAAATNDLQILSGANLQINPNFSLSVNGTMDNQEGNAGLQIKSDASGTGSFINATADVPATVERYLTGTQWHYLASPIVGAPLSLFNTNNFYFYDETEEDSWAGANFTTANNGWITETAPSLTSILGYAYYYYQTTLLFEGNLHTGTYTSPALSWTDTPVADSYEGWHLLGNPYPSAIDFSAANITATNINLSDVEPSVYFYDDIAHNYKGYNTSSGGINGGTQYIPAMQGFFVHATVNNAIFEVENGARVHNTTDFYKTEKLNENFITLQTTANGYLDETRIIENTDANFSFDSNYDLYKMFSRDENVPQIWQITEGVEFALNAIPYLSDEQIIPIGFKGDNSDVYQINLSENSFSNNVYLIDNLLNRSQNLSENPIYTFTHSGGVDLSRFELHFIQSTNLTNNVENHILVYPNPTTGIVNINLTGLKDLSGLSLQITDVSGKIIEQSNNTKIDLSNQPSGIYFIKIKTDEGVFVEKLIVE